MKFIGKREGFNVEFVKAEAVEYQVLKSYFLCNWITAWSRVLIKSQ